MFQRTSIYLGILLLLAACQSRDAKLLQAILKAHARARKVDHIELQQLVLLDVNQLTEKEYLTYACRDANNQIKELKFALLLDSVRLSQRGKSVGHQQKQRADSLRYNTKQITSMTRAYDSLLAVTSKADHKHFYAYIVRYRYTTNTPYGLYHDTTHLIISRDFQPVSYHP